jgi:photosystem II stability/assembly factor-like uncharacterized protein
MAQNNAQVDNLGAVIVTRRNRLKSFTFSSLLLAAFFLLASPGYLGSAACAAWHAVGPYGGSSDIVRAATDNSGRVIAGTRNGQIYSSADGGSTWSRQPFPGEFSGVLHALEIDPTDSLRWYAGIESEFARRSGVYRTTDGGQTWTFLEGMAGKAIWSLAIWDSDSKIVVAGAGDGVHRTSDGGETWTRISPGSNLDLRPVSALAIDSGNADLIYAGTTHLPWQTVDGGRTWRSMHSGMLDDSDVFSIVIHPANRRILYSSACSGAYRSANGGARWSRMPTPRGAFRTYVVAVDPRTPTIVFSGTSAGLLRSADEGKTWHKVSPHVVRSIDFGGSTGAGAAKIYFASETAGILVSTDGGKTLKESNLGFSNRNWIAFAASGSRLYAASTRHSQGGLFRSDDLGQAWTRVGTAESIGGEDIRHLAADPEQRDLLYAATRNRVWKSSDGGKTFTSLGSAPSGSHVLGISSRGLSEPPLVTTSAGVFRAGAPEKWVNVQAGAVSKVESAHVSGKDIVLCGPEAITFSSDGGQGWTKCDLPAPRLHCNDVRSVAKQLLAATSYGLFRSSAGCADWSLIRKGIEASTVLNIGSHPLRQEFFIVQRGRLLRSSDGGETWSTSSETATDETTPIRLLVPSESPERLYGLFPQRGVQYRPLSGIDKAVPTQSNRSAESKTQ